MTPEDKLIRKRTQSAINAKKYRAIARERGYCQSCIKNIARTGKTTCWKCFDHQIERQRLRKTKVRE